MQKKRFASWALVVAGTSVTYLDAAAGPQLSQIGDAGVQRAIYIAGTEKTQDQAAEVAKQATGGKVLSVRTIPEAGGQKVYEVKMLSTDGRVIVIRVDGQTGIVLH